MKVHEKELAKANAKVNALQEKLMPKSFALRGMKKCALQEEKSSVCSSRSPSAGSSICISLFDDRGLQLPSQVDHAYEEDLQSSFFAKN